MKRGEREEGGEEGKVVLEIPMGLKGINVYPFPETVISNFVYLRGREHATKA